VVNDFARSLEGVRADGELARLFDINDRCGSGYQRCQWSSGKRPRPIKEPHLVRAAFEVASVLF